MLIVVGILVVGMIAGYLLRNKTRIIKINDNLTKWAIYLLLFLLGVAIGNNKEIMNNLHTLGLKALAITAGGVTGSIILGWIIYNHFFISKDEE